MIICGILGAKGYTGCELIRWLLKHPEVTIAFLGTRSEETIPVSTLLPSIASPENLCVETIDTKKVIETCDVIFLALPHTKSMTFVQEFIDKGKIIIDLSADFRFQNIAMYEKWYKVSHVAPQLCENAVYGLPELNSAKIRNADLIANPGCYPTAVLLGLIPLLEKKLIHRHSIIIDAKSGLSGAGKKCSSVTHFCEVAENFQSYKVNQHQHMPEMEEKLGAHAGQSVKIMFVPHLLPLIRGIHATMYVSKNEGVTFDAIYNELASAYEGQPFVRVLPEGKLPQLKNVANTNFCDIQCIDAGDQVIILSAIDNLVKGASGQAIQNMNVRLGFDQSLGLL